MTGWYIDGSGWLAPLLMAALLLVLACVAGWAAVQFLRSDVGAGPDPEPTASPRATLDRRLAAGEIDAEQYAQLRRLIDGSSAVGVSPGEAPRP